ncbi:MAG TPA: NUDIX domain-containing protein [Candidatus Nanoarchaeia archaeon]|nr:NUDIX domain-containing protein [Candidatus Nanoarchaeia archaeon]
MDKIVFYDQRKGVDFTGITIVFICHDGGGNFLMAKRSKNCRDEQGNWDIGGGSLEFSENILDTLKREIEEEYCTEVLEHEFLGYREVHRENNGVKSHWIAFDFKVKVDKSKVKIGEPHKQDDIGWFTLSNLPAPVHSQFPIFLGRYKNKL